MKIFTIKSRQEYRVAMNNQLYRFRLYSNTPAQPKSDDKVQIYTRTSNLGLHPLSRFGGALTPAGIRAFLDGNGLGETNLEIHGAGLIEQAAADLNEIIRDKRDVLPMDVHGDLRLIASYLDEYLSNQ